MAREAFLIIEDNQYNVHTLDYMLIKPYDNNFKPSACTQGGLIDFVIKSPKKGDLKFYDWMNSISEVKDGHFILPVMEGIDKQDKELAFKKAHCIRLQESYSLANKGGSKSSLFSTVGSFLPLPFAKQGGAALDWAMDNIFSGNGMSVEMYMKLTISAAIIKFDDALAFRNKAIPS